jgi:hypothetical protein
MENTNKSKAKPLIIAIIAIVILGAFTYYSRSTNPLVSDKASTSTPSQTETKVPEVPKSVETTTTQPKPATTASSVSTAGWKTHTNTKYGFQIKYPSTWIIRQTDSGSPYITLIKPVNGDESAGAYNIGYTYVLIYPTGRLSNGMPDLPYTTGGVVMNEAIKATTVKLANGEVAVMGIKFTNPPYSNRNTEIYAGIKVNNLESTPTLVKGTLESADKAEVQTILKTFSFIR